MSVLVAEKILFEKDTKEALANAPTCESIAYVPMTISTPISLEPIIRELPITVCVCGEPTLEKTPCGKCILIQELCVRVPIEISVESHIGNTPPCCECIPRQSSKEEPKCSKTPKSIYDQEPYWGR